MKRPKALNWWQGMLIAIGVIGLAIGGVFIYTYVKTGFQGSKVYPDSISFTQPENADGSTEFNTTTNQFEVDSNFTMVFTTTTAEVTQKNITLSFNNSFSAENDRVTTEGDGADAIKYINNGIIKVPQTVEVGTAFEVIVLKAEESQFNIGGQSVIYAKSANNQAETISIKVAVDVVVDELKITAQDLTSNEYLEGTLGESAVGGATDGVPNGMGSGSVVNVVKGSNVKINALFTPEDSRYAFDKGIATNPRMKDTFFAITEGTQALTFNYDGGNIYFSATGEVGNTSVVTAYAFKTAKDQNKFYAENSLFTGESLYNMAVSYLAANAGKAVSATTSITLTDINVSSFTGIETAQNVSINSLYSYTVGVGTPSFNINIEDNNGDPIAAKISELGIRFVTRAGTEGNYTYSVTDDIAVQGSSTKEVEGGSYTTIKTARDLNNSYWEISSRTEGTYYAEIVLFTTVVNGGVTTEIWGDRVIRVPFIFTESEGGSVAWIDNSQINMTIIYDEGNAVVSQYSQNLSENINIPMANLYQKAVYLVKGLNLDTSNALYDTPAERIGAYNEYFTILSEVQVGEEYYYEISQDLLVKKATGENSFSIYFATVKADAYGTIIKNAGNYIIDKMSTGIRINAVETMKASDFRGTISPEAPYNNPTEDIYSVPTGVADVLTITMENPSALLLTEFNNGNISFWWGERELQASAILDLDDPAKCAGFKISTTGITVDVEAGESLSVTIKYNNSVAVIDYSGAIINYNPTSSIMIYTPNIQTIEMTPANTYYITQVMNANGTFTTNWFNDAGRTSPAAHNTKISAEAKDFYGREVDAIANYISTDSSVVAVGADGTLTFGTVNNRVAEIYVSYVGSNTTSPRLTLHVNSQGVDKIEISKEKTGFTGIEYNEEQDYRASLGTTRTGYKDNEIKLNDSSYPLVKLKASGTSITDNNIIYTLSNAFIAGFKPDKKAMLDTMLYFNNNPEMTFSDLSEATRITQINVVKDFGIDFDIPLQMTVGSTNLQTFTLTIKSNVSEVTSKLNHPVVGETTRTLYASYPYALNSGEYEISVTKIHKVGPDAMTIAFTSGYEVKDSLGESIGEIVYSEGDATLTFNEIYANQAPQEITLYTDYISGTYIDTNGTSKPIGGNFYAFNITHTIKLLMNLKVEQVKEDIYLEDLDNNQAISGLLTVKRIAGVAGVPTGLSTVISYNNTAVPSPVIKINDDGNAIERIPSSQFVLNANETHKTFGLSVSGNGTEIGALDFKLKSKFTIENVARSNEWIENVTYNGKEYLFVSTNTTGETFTSPSLSENSIYSLKPVRVLNVYTVNVEDNAFKIAVSPTASQNLYTDKSLMLVIEQSGSQIGTIYLPLLISSVGKDFVYYENYNESTTGFDLATLLGDTATLEENGIFEEYVAGTTLPKSGEESVLVANIYYKVQTATENIAETEIVTDDKYIKIGTNYYEVQTATGNIAETEIVTDDKYIKIGTNYYKASIMKNGIVYDSSVASIEAMEIETNIIDRFGRSVATIENQIVKLSDYAGEEGFIVVKNTLKSKENNTLLDYYYRIKVKPNLEVSAVKYPTSAGQQHLTIDGGSVTVGLDDPITAGEGSQNVGEYRFGITNVVGATLPTLAYTDILTSLNFDNSNIDINTLAKQITEAGTSWTYATASASITITITNDHDITFTTEGEKKFIVVGITRLWTGVCYGNSEYIFAINVTSGISSYEMRYASVSENTWSIDPKEREEQTLTATTYGISSGISYEVDTNAVTTTASLLDGSSSITPTIAGSAQTFNILNGDTSAITVTYDYMTKEIKLTVNNFLTKDYELTMNFFANGISTANPLTIKVNGSVKVEERNENSFAGGATYSFNELVGTVSKFDDGSYATVTTGYTATIAEVNSPESAFYSIENKETITIYDIYEDKSLTLKFTVAFGADDIYKFTRTFTFTKNMTYENGNDIVLKDLGLPVNSYQVNGGSVYAANKVEISHGGYLSGITTPENLRAINIINGSNDLSSEPSITDDKITFTPSVVNANKIINLTFEITYENGDYTFTFYLRVQLEVKPNAIGYANYPNLTGSAGGELDYESLEDGEIANILVFLTEQSSILAVEKNSANSIDETGLKTRVRFYTKSLANSEEQLPPAADLTEAKITIADKGYATVKSNETEKSIGEEVSGELTFTSITGGESFVTFNVYYSGYNVEYTIHLIKANEISVGIINTINTKVETIANNDVAVETIYLDNQTDNTIFNGQRLVKIKVRDASQLSPDKVYVVEMTNGEDTKNIGFKIDRTQLINGMTICLDAGIDLTGYSLNKIIEKEFNTLVSGGSLGFEPTGVIASRLEFTYGLKDGSRATITNSNITSEPKVGGTSLSAWGVVEDDTTPSPITIKTEGLELTTTYYYKLALDIAVGTSLNGGETFFEIEAHKGGYYNLIDQAQITKASTYEKLQKEDFENITTTLSVYRNESVHTAADTAYTAYLNKLSSEDQELAAETMEKMNNNPSLRFLTYTDVKKANGQPYNYYLFGEGAANNGSMVMLIYTYTAGSKTQTFYIMVKILPDYIVKIGSTVIEAEEDGSMSNVGSPVSAVMGTSGYSLKLAPSPNDTGYVLSIQNINWSNTNVAYSWGYKMEENTDTIYNLEMDKVTMTGDEDSSNTISRPEGESASVVINRNGLVQFGRKTYKVVISNKYGFTIDFFFTLDPVNSENPEASINSTQTFTEGDVFDIGVIYQEINPTPTTTITLQPGSYGVTKVPGEGDATHYTYTVDDKTYIIPATSITSPNEITTDGTILTLTIADSGDPITAILEETEYNPGTITAQNEPTQDKKIINLQGIDAWGFSGNNYNPSLKNNDPLKEMGITDQSLIDAEKMTLQYVSVQNIEYIYNGQSVGSTSGSAYNIVDTEKKFFYAEEGILYSLPMVDTASPKRYTVEANKLTLTDISEIEMTNEANGSRKTISGPSISGFDTSGKTIFLVDDQFYYVKSTTSTGDYTIVDGVITINSVEITPVNNGAPKNLFSDSGKTLATSKELKWWEDPQITYRDMANNFKIPKLDGNAYRESANITLTMRIKLQYKKDTDTETCYVDYPITVNRKLGIREATDRVVADGTAFDLSSKIHLANGTGTTAYYDDTLVVTLPSSGGSVKVEVAVSRSSDDTATGSWSRTNNNTTREVSYYISLSNLVGRTINPTEDTIKITFSNYDPSKTIQGEVEYKGFYARMIGVDTENSTPIVKSGLGEGTDVSANGISLAEITEDTIYLENSGLRGLNDYVYVTKSYIIQDGEGDNVKYYSYSRNYIVTPTYAILDQNIGNETGKTVQATPVGNEEGPYTIEFASWFAGMKFYDGKTDENGIFGRSDSNNSSPNTSRLKFTVAVNGQEGTATIDEKSGKITTIAGSGISPGSDAYIQVNIYVKSSGCDGSFSQESDYDYTKLGGSADHPNGSIRLFLA